ncbi:MAG: hypothetical protein NZ529_07810 [Cytophagaceae bacterium]|nr:hypothetical protein [Cytophagaceae bacterium]MDW8456691.1 hypothetical protein [Cytophagaceae bacterium]
MKYRIHYFLIVACSCLTSCFEVIEEVNFNPDGSGSFIFTINLNQSKHQLNRILSEDSIHGKTIPTKKDMDSILNHLLHKIKQCKGISDVQVSKNHTDYIYSIKYNFSTVAALNNSVFILIQQITSKKFVIKPQVYFVYRDDYFKRIPDTLLIHQIRNKIGIVEKEILFKATYTAVYRFAKEIKQHSNSGIILSKNKKASIFTSSVLDIINQKKTLYNHIILQ